MKHQVQLLHFQGLHYSNIFSYVEVYCVPHTHPIGGQGSSSEIYTLALTVSAEAFKFEPFSHTLVVMQGQLNLTLHPTCSQGSGSGMYPLALAISGVAVTFKPIPPTLVANAVAEKFNSLPDHTLSLLSYSPSSLQQCSFVQCQY